MLTARGGTGGIVEKRKIVRGPIDYGLLFIGPPGPRTSCNMRILKLARAIADLAGSETVRVSHVRSGALAALPEAAVSQRMQ